MPKFTVYVSKEWAERGEIQVEAPNEDEARDAAMEALVDGSDDIRWNGANMDPGNIYVDKVEGERGGDERGKP